MQNHVIDPTFFYDAIEEFAFNYDWYPVARTTIDDMGRQTYGFDHRTIRGSLQSDGTSLNMSKDVNTESMTYRFYCKSLYRIGIGDFILYKNRYLHVDSVRDFDEYGVRRCTLRMVDLTNYKDFEEYIKYLQGLVIV